MSIATELADKHKGRADDCGELARAVLADRERQAGEAVAHANSVQWRNIKRVVHAVADFCFGSPPGPKYLSAHTAVVQSLTAKDGIGRIALEPFDFASLPAPQAVQAGPTHTEVYAEGRGDQFKDDCAVIQLLLENCDDADTYGDGQMNTTRIRELLTHFDTALAAAPSPDGKAEQAEAPSDAAREVLAAGIVHHYGVPEETSFACARRVLALATQPTTSNAGEQS